MNFMNYEVSMRFTYWKCILSCYVIKGIDGRRAKAKLDKILILSLLVESEINVSPNSMSDRPKWNKFITISRLYNSNQNPEIFIQFYLYLVYILNQLKDIL